MKKCLKCNKEYENSDNFCPCCGERLVETNVCQKCGYPVAVEDVYCRHCGYKIEKEYRCEKCNAVITEGAKFCSECGSNVTNPVISIVSNGKAPVAKSKVEKILFYVANSIALVLFVLMLVGCFGDLTKSYTSSSAGINSSSTVSIGYFFGDAIKSYQQRMESVKYNGYDSLASLEITLKYIFWLLAIGSTIFGLIRGSIGLCKAYKNNDYSEKNSALPIAAFGTIPYLTIIALTSDLYVVGKSATERIIYATSFGWGTTMILVSLIIFISITSISRLVCAVLEKKNIVYESVFCGIKLSLGILFLFILGQIVSITYKTGDAIVTGHATTYSIVMNNLYSFSTGATNVFTMECIYMLIAIVLILIGTVFGALFLFELFDSKKMIPLYIFGGLAIALLLTGYIISINSTKNYSESPYVILGIPSTTFRVCVIGIVFVALAFVSTAGLTVVKKLFKK